MDIGLPCELNHRESPDGLVADPQPHLGLIEPSYIPKLLQATEYSVKLRSLCKNKLMGH